MIRRLIGIITDIKAFVYNSAPLRIVCCLLIAAAMLLVYLYSETAEVSFVYNEF